MEPGRSIVADSGMTLYTVGSVKTITGYKSYVSVDGGMTDNPRYALYGSAYTVKLANKMNEEEKPAKPEKVIKEEKPVETKKTYASGTASPAAKKVLAENLKQRSFKEANIIKEATKIADAIKVLEIKIALIL